MIKTKQELKFWLKEDKKRNNMDIPYWKFLAKYICGNERATVFYYLKVLRHCEYHLNNKKMGGVIYHTLLYWYYKIRLDRLGLRYGLKVPVNRTGYGLRLMHISGGIHLNVERIGNYCGFNSGVLIGNKGSDEARPTIGDYTAFGPGAKAFGKITIGSHVFVAANAVVTKDIPDNSVTGGVPAKIIR